MDYQIDEPPNLQAKNLPMNHDPKHLALSLLLVL